MPGDNLATAPYPSAEEIQLVMEDPRLQSVKYLLDHQWFERGWVIQEAVLARDAVVIWGSRMTARFDSLMICHSWLFRSFRGVYAKFNVNPLSVLSHLYRYRFREVARYLGYSLETQPSLLRILDQARQAKFKNARDRVYAFLYLDGLEDRLDVAVDAASRLGIQPDYSKSVAEVYADFARHCFKSDDIKWLHYVQQTQQSLVQGGFASWVPRWDLREHCSLATRPSTHPSMHPSHDTSDGSQEMARFDGNCLIVQGVVFDRAYFQGSWSEWLQERDMFWQFLRAVEEDPDKAEGFKPHISRVEQCISVASTGRKLVSTDKGYFALAPRITEESDMCCIIFGCCFPFILREVKCPSASKEKSYRVVGDAWVAGKNAVPHPKGGLFMSRFGGQHSMEWETWGLKEGDIKLV
ncbi:hypothetical protein SLS64_008347 [Diaporthe eres]